MIGIIDADSLIYDAFFVPNLEVMKLYAYYKNQHDYVELIEHLDEPEKYEKIFLFRETDKATLPPEYWQHDNIITKGLYFTGKKYKPFQNIDIENATPSYKVYTKYFERKIEKNAAMARRCTNHIDSGFIRLHTPGRFQIQEAKTHRKIWIYDLDVLQDDGMDKLKQIKEYCPRLQYKYPVRVHTLDQFKQLKEYDLISVVSHENYHVEQQWGFVEATKLAFLYSQMGYIKSCGMNSIAVPVFSDPDGIFSVRIQIQRCLMNIYDLANAKIYVHIYNNFNGKCEYDGLIQAVSSYLYDRRLFPQSLYDILIRKGYKEMLEDVFYNNPNGLKRLKQPIRRVYE